MKIERLKVKDCTEKIVLSKFKKCWQIESSREHIIAFINTMLNQHERTNFKKTLKLNMPSKDVYEDMKNFRWTLKKGSKKSYVKERVDKITGKLITRYIYIPKSNRYKLDYCINHKYFKKLDFEFQEHLLMMNKRSKGDWKVSNKAFDSVILRKSYYLLKGPKI